MENITKALYLAIGVFIGIMLLTAFVWVFRNGGEFIETLSTEEINKKVEQYNAELSVYQRDNNTIYDVISACNLAYDINKQYDYDNVNYLEIEIENINGKTYKVENIDTLKSGFVKQGSNDILLISLINEDVGGNKLSAVKVGATDQERVYFHTFKGKVDYNEQGKIYLITFTLN